jgi:hypothetical protein
MGASVTALVLSEDEVEGALALGAAEALTSSAAFEGAKGRFDVVLNCASARVDGALVGGAGFFPFGGAGGGFLFGGGGGAGGGGGRAV